MLNGYFVGFGVEHAFSQNLSLKLEYRFSNYDEVPGTLAFDSEISSVRLGVNWKLGR
jgi:opacity protein-like surface antigen